MVSVACVGVRISVIFHLMFVHNTFSSVWVVPMLLKYFRNQHNYSIAKIGV